MMPGDGLSRPRRPAGHQDRPKLTLLQQSGLNIGYLAFNTQKKPFDDKRVRQALTMALDKKAILDAVYQGAGQPAKNLIPPTMWSYNNAVQGLSARPRGGEEAARRRRLPERLRHRPMGDAGAAPLQPDARRIAELMQADLMKIGVRAKIVSYEWGEYRKRIAAGEAPDGRITAGPATTATRTISSSPLASCSAARVGGGSASKWCNKDFDALILKAATLPNQADRAKLYEQAQVVMHDDAPFFLIAHSVTFQPLRKEVEGYVMSPLGGHIFDQVDLK
ncbi:MAG: ABC transporter substrate-binding protein [Acetobacteraceae bacterium]